MSVFGIGSLQRLDRDDRDLLFDTLRTIVVTLVIALVVLFALTYVMSCIFLGARNPLPFVDRLWIAFRSFTATAVVMFVAFGIAVARISRKVTAHVRARESARLAKEMELARDIQIGALPQTFPPYPTRRSFDIYATMRPARDVGGDFYDFYFADEDHLVFLVADVSGKGVPAALFMMRAKSLLKSHIQSGVPLAEAVSVANGLLCEGNTAGLFVTAWIAELDTKTGRVTYVNAGHNPPLRRRAVERRAEYVRDDPCLFLGALAGVPYVARELQLTPGESLYLYTDGMTEQVNEGMELFGEERLCKVLCGTRATLRDLLECVSRNVIRFGGAAEQTDDRTQLELVWRGSPVRKTHAYAPTMEALAQASADLDADLCDIPFDVKMTILAAADELFMNIVSHSGATSWSLGVERAAFPNEVTVVLEDDGKPFDPLALGDPDTSIAIEDRKVGGLGLFIVKKTMSPVTYARRDGRNVFSMGKTLEPPAETVELSEKALSDRKIEART